ILLKPSLGATAVFAAQYRIWRYKEPPHLYAERNRRRWPRRGPSPRSRLSHSENRPCLRRRILRPRPCTGIHSRPPFSRPHAELFLLLPSGNETAESHLRQRRESCREKPGVQAQRCCVAYIVSTRVLKSRMN